MFHSTPHWFFITGHDLNFFTWWFIASSLWAWFVFFDVMLYFFILSGLGSCCFTSLFTGSSLLGIICTVSLPPMVHHY
jgi:hypothetical protein